jgi:hypothetical protein
MIERQHHAAVPASCWPKDQDLFAIDAPVAGIADHHFRLAKEHHRIVFRFGARSRMHRRPAERRDDSTAPEREQQEER